MDNEPFSNPLAPPSAPSAKSDNIHVPDRSQPLTNDDFRKLMMTPRAVGHNQSSVPGSVRGSIRNKHGRNFKVEQNENVKKKKKINEMIKKQEGDILHELAKKYRDRAKERREGTSTDSLRGSEILPNTAYHAVGPDNLDMDAAERRKLIIQESKYLGGDMEHTHLVKGLDYVLLQKVKAEMESKEEEELSQKQLEELEESIKNEEEKRKKAADDGFDDQDRYAIKSKRAQNLLRIVFNKNLPEKNELFIQGRMAYQYDLTQEFMDNEIPTTIIRSKAECPNLDAYNSISTNEIIINKLIQIWTYIRQGASKKQRKKLESSINDRNDKGEKRKAKNDIGDDIYDDVGEYIPDIKSKKSSSNHVHGEKQQEKKKSYFETKAPKHVDNDDDEIDEKQTMELAAQVVGSFASTNQIITKVNKKPKYQEPESYAECYPGAPENDDAILDSDDDYEDNFQDTQDTNKKGPTKRWDFDNEEEYNDFLNNKEVIPKGVYQYGQKNNDGRNNHQSNHQKMRKNPPKKDEKAKLDREYQKINALINKKKQQGEKIGMSFMSNKDR